MAEPGKKASRKFSTTLALSKHPRSAAMKFSTNGNIKIKSAMDENDCWITGIAVYPPHQLFVADFDNKSIKMIDIINGDIKQLKLKSEPWDITIVNRNTLAVTLPDIDAIRFISFTSNSLTMKNKQVVGGACHGITHQKGKFAVIFTGPSKLKILDLRGSTSITIEKDSNGDNIFNDPWYVTSNYHSIYVSDNGKDAIILFNWQGEMIGRLEGIKQPWGITRLDDGFFLVNDYINDCICRISSDCKDKETILKDVESPCAVYWCSKTSTIYVSSFSRFDTSENDNHIKMYKK